MYAELVLHISQLYCFGIKFLPSVESTALKDGVVLYYTRTLVLFLCASETDLPEGDSKHPYSDCYSIDIQTIIAYNCSPILIFSSIIS